MAARKRAQSKKPARQSGTKRGAWRWDDRKDRAAHLIAEGSFTFDEIAAQLKTGRTTLYRWLEHAEFAARVEQITTDLGDLARRFVLCRKTARLSSKQQRWRKLQAVIEARAADPDHQRGPGGKTGLLVRRQRMLGGGEHGVLIEEFELDTGLLREMSQLEKEAAEEAGQRTQKVEHSGPGGGPIREQVIIYVPDDGRNPPPAAPGAGTEERG